VEIDPVTPGSFELEPVDCKLAKLDAGSRATRAG